MAHTTNGRGTLAPGQSISVNKYNVQVDRYLSQGGFAHVYLVRTATPVYGTTHHVLKRIAVANDAMLTDVKKEVDIMRILKGHPNIVHLIDAAWHRMSDGTYEVFILMEFCPGGGIIDMMNRRLRERLTEAEILNIFVDVCEGVAAMHNLRPALLHRDLKVENILQASATSYKLCDFGSATSVAPRPPATTQEIRALEADLNRHTTLQYRAPEMVDPYLRRPVDEKSDVWALGVLLYKLCYYTTPFEEHGPLAILNVQYKIPPYPVYSVQMNSLIASMLREHGAHRPSIFELLQVVHQFRGTQSRFSYVIPEPEPLSPRGMSSKASSSGLDDLVTFRSQQSSNNAGTQARDKVLEAIAPMRRGRPARGESRSPSPTKDLSNDWLSGDSSSRFGTKEDQAWKAVTKTAGASSGIRGHKSGVVTSDAWRVKAPANEAWEIKGNSASTPGFESDFSTSGFGDSFNVPAFSSSTEPSNSRKAPSNSNSIPTLVRSSIIPGNSSSLGLDRLGAPRSFKSKDAFDGLGLSDKPPAPTLGEVRKARTGLALPMEQSFSPMRRSPQPPSQPPPQPSPQPSPQPPPITTKFQSQSQDLPIEDRFPSIEELDRRIFGTGETPSPPVSKLEHVPTSRGTRSDMDTGATVSSGVGYAAYRSQNVTGAGLRNQKNTPSKRQGESSTSVSEWLENRTSEPTSGIARRPSLTRKHRSSVAMHQNTSQFDISPELSTPAPREIPSSTSHAKDWLTGNGEEHAADILSRIHTNPATSVGGEHSAPVLRESPSKRASFFERSPHLIPEPLEGDVEQGELLPPPALPLRPSPSFAPARSPLPSSATGGRQPPPVTDMAQSKIGAGLTDNWSPVSVDKFPSTIHRKSSVTSDSGDEDEGPEDVIGYGSIRGNNDDSWDPKSKLAGKSKRRQSSVHDLVDLWGGSTVIDKGKPELLPKEQKRKSVILPSSTAIAAGTSNGLPRSSSPQPMLSSPASPRKSHIQSPPKEGNKNRKLTTTSSALSSPPIQKSTSSGPTKSRSSRPQSMLIFPSSKSSVDYGGLPSPGLELPPPGMRTISASRRTSISDMVHKYEGIGVGGKSPVANVYSGLPAPVPVKPIGLKVPTGDSSWRYTKTSPTSSPVKTMGSLPIPTSEDMYGDSGSRRTSPVGFSDRISPRRSPVRKKSMPTTAPANYSASAASTTGWEDSNASGDPKSPSPERPYTGVGRLIDQWQKKAGESNVGDGKKTGVIVPKRHGVTNGGAR